MNKMIRIVTLLAVGFVLGGCQENSGAELSPAVEQDYDVEVVDAELAAEADFADPDTAFSSSNSTAAETGSSEASAEEESQIFRSPIEVELGIVADPQALSQARVDYEAAVAEATTTCMRDLGYDDFVDTPDPVPSAETLLGTTATDDVALVGYGPAITLESWLEQVLSLGSEAPSTDPEGLDALVQFLDENPHLDEESVVSDVFGCEEEARLAFERPKEEVDDVVAQELLGVWKSVESDPNVAAMWDDWAVCMAENGYSFANRDAIRSHVEAEGGPLAGSLQAHLQSGEPPTNEEIDSYRVGVDDVVRLEYTIANSDTACSNQVKLEETIRRTITRVELEWLEENRERIPLLLREAELEN